MPVPQRPASMPAWLRRMRGRWCRISIFHPPNRRQTHDCSTGWRCSRFDGVEVRLALRCLLPHCPERWPLELYWDAAAQENDIGRAQGLTAAFNGIVRQLRKVGRYEDVPLL